MLEQSLLNTPGSHLRGITKSPGGSVNCYCTQQGGMSKTPEHGKAGSNGAFLVPWKCFRKSKLFLEENFFA